MGTLNLGNGASFTGGSNGLTDAPTGTIIQSDFFTTETTATASTTSFATLYTFNFTPRQTNSELVHHVWATTYLHNGSPSTTSQGQDCRVLRSGSAVWGVSWMNYLNHNSYTNDFYPNLDFQFVDAVQGSTSQIAYTFQARKYQGDSNKFATQYGSNNGYSGGAMLGNRFVWRIDEYAV